MPYTLLNDGDGFEQRYWSQFLSTQFPTFQTYWASKIVPLTNRPIDIHFKKSSALATAGHSPEEVCNAQLHYTVLRHLVRAFEILKHLKNRNPQDYFDIDLLGEGLFHICAAQDVAFEFLQRNDTPNIFDPWAATKRQSTTGTKGSKEAKEKWQKDNGHPLQDIRDYRNHLMHGRLSPSMIGATKISVPKISKENQYLDWRIITDGYPAATHLTDFDTLENILQEAWDKTITYLETEWQQI